MSTLRRPAARPSSGTATNDTIVIGSDDDDADDGDDGSEPDLPFHFDLVQNGFDIMSINDASDLEDEVRKQADLQYPPYLAGVPAHWGYLRHDFMIDTEPWDYETAANFLHADKIAETRMLADRAAFARENGDGEGWENIPATEEIAADFAMDIEKVIGWPHRTGDGNDGLIAVVTTDEHRKAAIMVRRERILKQVDYQHMCMTGDEATQRLPYEQQKKNHLAFLSTLSETLRERYVKLTSLSCALISKSGNNSAYYILCFLTSSSPINDDVVFASARQSGSTKPNTEGQAGANGTV